MNNRLIDQIHKRWLIRCMKKFNGNRTKIANYLGVSIRTVRNWLLDFGLKDKF